MVHRAILGSLERFVGVLIEHFGGRFPVWCAPTQVAVIPIREEHADYGQQLVEKLEAKQLRVAAMLEKGHMNKKIKVAQKEQIPFMLIVGEREMLDGTVALRRRGTREQVTVPFDEFLELVTGLVESRSLELE
jgi:threonyl-tRNA synthetase